MPFYKPKLQTWSYFLIINTKTPLLKGLTMSAWYPSGLLYSKIKNKRKGHLKQHCACQPWSKIATIASFADLAHGCSSLGSPCWRMLSLVFWSYLVKHPAIPSESCITIYTKELDTDCSSSESTSSSHEKLKVSNSITVTKINLLSLGFSLPIFK